MNENQINIKTLDIVLDAKTVTLSKIPLRKYAELLKTLNEIPKIIATLDRKSVESIIASLPKMVTECYPELCKVISIGTGMTDEEIGELALDELSKLLVGIITVNRYAEVWDNLKKGIAQSMTLGTKVEATTE